MSPFVPGRIVGRAQRFAISAMMGATCASIPAAASGQDMDVPVAMQVALFLKVVTFDRNLVIAPATDMVVAVAYQGGYRASVTAKDDAMSALQLNRSQQKIRAVAIDLDRESLAAALGRHNPSVLYVAPLRGIDISDLATIARRAGVTTVTGVAAYVSLGLAVSVRLQGERPKLLINPEAARLEGADFTAALLNLAQISR
jgi:hypothetical protein